MCASKRLSMEERKQEIMASASRFIIEKGFSNTTMEDVIAGTSMSKGGVYHYYKSTVEILRDLMLEGIEYRNNIIHDHISECSSGCEIEFMAKQMVDKVIDDHEYMPIYVEFLIEKKRNIELQKLFEELKMQTLKRFKEIMKDMPDYFFNKSTFDLVTDFLNAMILASDVLDARDNFRKNRRTIENMMVLLFRSSLEVKDEGL